MVSALRSKILGADDLKKHTEHIPEWGVTVEVWGMTGAERAWATTGARGPEGKIDGAKLAGNALIVTLHDPETGALILEEADRDALLAKSGAVLDRLAAIVYRLSGMADDEVKEIEKNSETASGDTTSDSPKPSA